MRRSILTGVALGLGVLVFLDAVAARAGAAALLVPRLDGPGAWLASRAAGITAYVALTLDVVLGLFVSTGAADRWLPRARSLELHRWLSGATLALVLLHALVLLLDSEAALDLVDLLVPLASSYRPIAVAAGIVGFAAALVVRESFGWRARLGPKTWRRLHALSFVAFALATAHGLAAGTDSGTAAMRALYVVSTAAVVLLAAARVKRRPPHVGRRPPAPARRAPSAPIADA